MFNVGYIILGALLIQPICLAQEVSFTSDQSAKEAAEIIEMKRVAWSRQQKRDPSYYEELKRNLSSEYVYKEARQRADRAQYLKDVVNTYLESYELFDFEVTFQTPTDAVMTHKALFRVRGYGKSALKSCFFTTVLRKTNGVWREKSYTGKSIK